MTIDLTDPEVMKAIKDAGFVAQEDVAGLKAKRDELLAKVASGKATAEQLAEAQAKLEEIEQAKLKDAEDWQTLEGKLRAEMSDKEKALNELNSNLTNTLIERDLMSALAAANIAPHFLEAAKALLRGKVELNEGKAVVEGNDLAAYVSEWAASDHGKHFVAAPDNSGGGAPGGNKPNNGVKKWSELSTAEKVELNKTDPAEYQRLKNER